MKYETETIIYCPQSFSGGGLYLMVNWLLGACMMGYYQGCSPHPAPPHRKTGCPAPRKSKPCTVVLNGGSGGGYPKSG